MNQGNEISAYFTDSARAEEARASLEDAGISPGNIEVHDAAGTSTSRTGESFMDRVKDFFTGESSATTTGDGGCIVTVYDSSGSAEDILRRSGGQLRGTGASSGAYGTTMGTGTTVGDDDAERTLRLREERLQVDKQRVQQGEVRVGKEVVTEHREVDVPVTREDVYVERRPVTDGAYDADAGELGEGETVTVPVMRDEVSVQKRTEAVEEVAIGKRRTQDTQTVGADVRRERARVETSGNVDSIGDDLPEDGRI